MRNVLWPCNLTIIGLLIFSSTPEATWAQTFSQSPSVLGENALEPTLPLPELEPDADTPASSPPTTALEPGQDISSIPESSANSTPFYSVEFLGVQESALEAQIRAHSVLWANRRTRLDSLAQLRRRLQEDTNTILKLVRAEGYYGANLETRITPTTSTREDALNITITITLGPRYVFKDITIEGITDLHADLAKILGFMPGSPVITQNMLEGETQLKHQLPILGYPFASLGERHVIIHHEAQNATYQMTVTLGPKARFGPLEFAGKPTLKHSHIQKLARFKSGDLYDQNKIDDLRQTLLLTNLFSEVSVEPRRPDKSLSPDGTMTVPIVITTLPAKERTIAANLGYGAGEGPRAEASWQHRNLWGGQEQLTLTGLFGTREQSFVTDLRRLNFDGRDRTIYSRLSLAHQTPDAFNAYKVELGVGLQRENGPTGQKRWLYSFGLDTEVAKITLKGANNSQTFIQLSAPLSLRYDGSNDLFDPTRGFKIYSVVTPEGAYQSSVFGYVKAELGASGYLSLDSLNRFVAAGQIRGGALVGSRRDRVAANRRFYAGGGGSIRGYSYQGVGPVNNDGTPLGGRSLVEISAELRLRLWEKISLVPFLDGGNVYDASLPKFTNFRWGAGIGIRYHTSFAPIRLDITTPLNRRPGESRVTFYVGLAQNF